MKLTNARGVLLAIAVAFAALGAGCGSDDGGGGGGDDAAPAAQTPGTATDAGASSSSGGAEEQEIRALFANMRQAIAATDGARACALMARLSQQTFVRIAQNGQKTCAQGFEEAFADGTAEDLDPKLVRVEIQGPRATVYARAKTSKQLQQAPFVKEGGSWKVESWLTD